MIKLRYLNTFIITTKADQLITIITQIDIIVQNKKCKSEIFLLLDDFYRL